MAKATQEKIQFMSRNDRYLYRLKIPFFKKQQRDHTEVLEIFHLFIKTHRKHEPATKELETQTPKSD